MSSGVGANGIGYLWREQALKGMEPLADFGWRQRGLITIIGVWIEDIAMTMTVELGALEQVVDRLVRDGRYGSKSEVLRTGVRLVQEHEARLAALLGKLEEGIADADAGRTSSLEDVRAEFEARWAAEGE
jgi:antitoxin ParD1/3/4